MSCWDRQPIQPLVEEFLLTDRPPKCVKCAGHMKHATISFGQALPAEVLEQAYEWCRTCDLFFAIGSSLVVTPAADLPAVAKRHGSRLVIINRDPTPLDGIADEVIHESIGDSLTRIAGRFK